MTSDPPPACPTFHGCCLSLTFDPAFCPCSHSVTYFFDLSLAPLFLTLDFNLPPVLLTFTLTSYPQPLTSPCRCDSAFLPTHMTSGTMTLILLTCPYLSSAPALRLLPPPSDPVNSLTSYLLPTQTLALSLPS